MIAHKTGGTKMSQAPTGPSGDLVPERKPTISKIANPTTSMARMLQNIFVIGSVFITLRAQCEKEIDHSGDDAQFSFRLARQYSGTELAILFERHSGQPRITVRGSATRNPGGTGRDLSLLDSLNSASDFHSHLFWGRRFRLAALGNLSHSIKAFSTGAPLVLSHSLIAGPAAWP